jgi:hypothetical protein
VAYQGRRVRVADRWWPLRVPAVVAGLLLVERLLMDEVGTPATLLRELGDLGDARTSPVGSMLALMALLVEAIAQLRPGGPGAPVAVHAAWAHGPDRRPIGVRGHPGRGPSPARPARRGRAVRPGDPGGDAGRAATSVERPPADSSLAALPTPALLAVDRGMFSWFFFVMLPRLRTSRERVSGRTRVDGTPWCSLSGCGEAFGVVPD